MDNKTIQNSSKGCLLGYFVKIGSYEIFTSVKADTLFLITNYKATGLHTIRKGF